MLFHRKSCFLCREQSRGTGFIAFIKIIAAGDAPLGQRQGGVFRVPPPSLWTPPTPQRERGCSPLVTPKLLGSIQKIQVASLKDFLCSADWKPLSRCATAPSKREPLAKPESVMVCPETLPLCQGLSLWESWQARQGLTERASQLPGAHSKSLIRLPKPCSF